MAGPPMTHRQLLPLQSAMTPARSVAQMPPKTKPSDNTPIARGSDRVENQLGVCFTMPPQPAAPARRFRL